MNKSLAILTSTAALWLAAFCIAPFEASAQQSKQTFASSPAVSKTQLDKIVVSAFAATHDGWSSDEVILNDVLNAAYLEACHAELPTVSDAELNWRLMNLRKAGKLKPKSSKRNRDSLSEYLLVAEIAARATQDKNKVSIDKIMATPEMKTQFDNVAKSIDANIDLYLTRKAAFQLRKARKLRPELITRIADWGRKISTHSAETLKANPDSIAPHPGIYIFRDKTGYLYIGQTDDLRERLKTHLDQSHNLSLAKYLTNQQLTGISIELHSFQPDSRAKETMIRRAYESELIASRKPRFNIQP